MFTLGGWRWRSGDGWTMKDEKRVGHLEDYLSLAFSWLQLLLCGVEDYL